MHKTATEIDVLIVGAGPVGLFLANECCSPRAEMADCRDARNTVGALQGAGDISTHAGDL